MDSTMYVGLSKQILLQRELDIVANNLANVDTTGFKLESLISGTDSNDTARTIGVTQPVQFAVDNGVARDFTQGALRQTGAPLDLAISGTGFFEVQTAAGMRYTRDGRFTTNAQNQLVTQTGDLVLDASGSPITLNPQGQPPVIGRDGTITQTVSGQLGAQVMGKVGVFNFTDLSALSKQGDGLYSLNTNQTPQAATDPVVQQGMLEGSNVQPIIEITDLIRIQRAYEMVSQMLSSTSDLSSNAIQQIGSIQ
ncbi:MAG: flagellar basal-body rod protein FlgF [Caulobacteraceae bacterium]|nr:flagellar basal-body rod protein FlgF [Caulobacteraceae bacterium]